jgi:hypothetical protein
MREDLGDEVDQLLNLDGDHKTLFASTSAPILQWSA